MLSAIFAYARKEPPVELELTAQQLIYLMTRIGPESFALGQQVQKYSFRLELST